MAPAEPCLIRHSELEIRDFCMCDCWLAQQCALSPSPLRGEGGRRPGEGPFRVIQIASQDE